MSTRLLCFVHEVSICGLSCGGCQISYKTFERLFYPLFELIPVLFLCRLRYHLLLRCASHGSFFKKLVDKTKNGLGKVRRSLTPNKDRDGGSEVRPIFGLIQETCVASCASWVRSTLKIKYLSHCTDLISNDVYRRPCRSQSEAKLRSFGTYGALARRENYSRTP